MGHRDTVLAAAGYSARYERRLRYRGSHLVDVCLAERGGRQYFAFHDPGHYRRVRDVQHVIPNMARIADVVQDVAVFDAAPGRLLWDLDGPFTAAAVDAIEAQLVAFAHGTRACELIHGDLRPWNAMLADDGTLQVIDWGHSAFLSDLHLADGRITDHYARMHPGLPLDRTLDMDLRDAECLVRLLRRSSRYSREAWATYGIGVLPPWCDR